MERKPLMIFIAMGVGFGITVQILKSAAPSDPHLARLARLEALMDEGRPSYVPMLRIGMRNKAAYDKLNHGRVVGLAAAEKTVPAETPTPAPEVKKEVAKPDPKKDAKKDDKKKKKEDEKKKDDKPAAAGVNPLFQPPADDGKKPDSADNSGSAPSIPAGGAPTVPAAAGAAQNTNPQTVEEWEQFLLNPPSSQSMQAFITDFHDGQVASPTFYTVLEYMLTQNSDQVRELAVMGLGSAPSLRSFVDLTNLYDSNVGGTATSQAHVYLTAYANLTNLHYLTAALAPGEGTAINLEALQLIQLAIHNLHATTTISTSSTGVQTTATAPSATVVRYLTPVGSTLTSLITASTQNPTVKSAASSTLNELDALLGIGSTTASTETGTHTTTASAN